MLVKSDSYRKSIIKALCFKTVLSAQELAHSIDKSLPFTTKILNELVEEGTLRESGYATSTGGRRPLMYSLQGDQFYAITIAMDQLISRIGIIDLRNNEVTDIRKFDLPLAENKDALKRLVSEIRSYVDTIAIDREKIVGIGIGMPGFVDVANGVNHSFLKTDQKNGSITGVIEEALQLPVFIDNDSSLIALTELKLGSAKSHKNAMVINFGWGIGLGMIINGELFRGQTGFAGEFSHIPLFDNNRLCSCGKSGCLETEASLFVIIQKAREALNAGRVSSIKDLPADAEAASVAIFRAALAGDQLAVELLSDTAYNIGRGIAILIHIMNPELVIISGRGAMAGNMLLAPIYQAVNKYCIPRLAAYTGIGVSTFGPDAELLGAAALVVENFDKKRIGKPLQRNVLN